MMYTNKTLIFILGMLVGILARRFALSIRTANGFCKRILPALHDLKKYSQMLTNRLLALEIHDQALVAGKIELQKSLLERYSSYPEWIFKVGFNPGLRSGFRSFLIHLECVVELHFAIASTVIFHENLKLSSSDEVIAMSHDEVVRFKEDIRFLSQPIARVMQQNEELMDILILFCESHAVKEITNGDYIHDVKELDEQLKLIIPLQLELLDMSPSSIRVVSLVRDIKEVRQVLLQLLASLPS